jgi:YVTN family beta-propeller protein
MKRRFISTTFLLMAFGYASTMPSQTAGFQVEGTYSLGVSGGYDYMAFDPASHLLYIAQGTQAVVFNVDTHTVAHLITGLVHAHGFVFDGSGKIGYLSDGGANVVRIFDRTSFKEVGQIPVGVNPDGMVLEPTTGHLFVFNGKSKNLSVVDVASRQVVATVPVPGKPEFPTADGAGFVYDNIEDTHQVLKISAAQNKVVATWTIAGCESPSGMAIDPPSHRIAPVCDNGKMPVINTANGQVVAMPTIGTGPDAVVFDAKRKLFFSSNGDTGTLSVVEQKNADAYTTIGTVKTAPKGRTLALDSHTGKIYIVAPDPKSTAPIASQPLVLLEIGR